MADSHKSCSVPLITFAYTTDMDVPTPGLLGTSIIACKGLGLENDLDL